MAQRVRFLVRISALLIMLGLPLGLQAEPSTEPQARTKIVAFGDSLTAGLGVSREQAYPAQLEQRLRADGCTCDVINAGVSGDTTAGGRRRVDWILKSRPQVVILELGANDGLRGLSLEQTRANLAAIIEQLLSAEVQVVLAGMKLPPNYGKDYTEGFEQLFPALAAQYRLPLIGFFLEGVAAHPTLNQADGIHPTAGGYRIVAEQVHRTLTPLLTEPLPNGKGRS